MTSVSNGIDLAQATTRLRTAGLDGDKEAFVSAYAIAKRIAADIRSDACSAGRDWFSLLRFDIETANVPEILSDVARGKIAAPENHEMLSRIVRFIDEHGPLLAKTHLCVQELGCGRHWEVTEEVCIGTWFRLLLLPEEYASSRDIWLLTAEATIDIAVKKVMTTFLLPDYLTALVTLRSPHFLSFHTMGKAPGVMHFKPSDFPRRVILDEGGYSGWSSLANARLEDLDVPDVDTVEAFFQAHKRKVSEENISKYAQNSKTSLAPFPANFMFVALQVSTDRTQVLARVPMLQMLDIVVRRFKGSETKVVVKRHPKCNDATVTDYLAELESRGDIIITESSIHDILPRSIGICTVNSGVGSEAIVYLKPIYLFGEADYNCISYRISNFEQFAEATSKVISAKTQYDMKKFLYYYRNEYQTEVDDKPTLQQKIASKFFAFNDYSRDI